MKRSAILLFILTICLTLSLFGCNPTPNESGNDSASESTSLPDEQEFLTITVAKALELCGEVGNITTERYYIRATITKIENAQYGAMTVADETGSIYVYGTYSEDGSVGYAQMTEKPYAGDEVLIYCTLQNYNGTKEVQNARLIEFKKNEQTFDESDYTEMSVAQARAAAKGTKVKVDGVVAAITYANGKIPSGVYLIDESGSIYVYDSDLAQRVRVGNKLTILASKTYWILDSEQSNAQKFGYIGCNQLEAVKLVSNDEKTDNAFDRSWISESTVKAIVDNPVTNDITTNVYKVTAQVKKVEGTGFTNYYINDLDGKTGSYVYTQCNGSDFAWLDKYDGKICTVYLSAINAKSTASDCFYRFFPVAVEDNGFTFDKKNTAEHVVKYYGAGQFEASYTGNPALELVTKVSSELLGFTDAQITYTSSNTAIISIDTANGKTVMNCVGTGQAEITVSCTFEGVTYSEKVKITVGENDEHEYISVGEAIAAEKNTEVTVKGIVGPSLVNQSGFYLIDESGVIAVLVDASVFDGISVGDEVILKGTRSVKYKDGTNTFGQSHIAGAEILANYYGDHDYSETSFDKSKTLADFYNLDVTKDFTTSVYVLTATVKLEKTAYYTNIKLTSGSTTVSLYCSGAGQYQWLQAYEGQEVTLEIAPCNWNGKNYYAGCVLAVHVPDGKVTNQLNFGN